MNLWKILVGLSRSELRYQGASMEFYKNAAHLIRSHSLSLKKFIVQGKGGKASKRKSLGATITTWNE